jgi:nephrocystin-3
MKTFKNREVRVFISSTFRDMHAEREILVKHVFPRLRQKCRARGVELTEIDLRWGLTEEQTQNMTDVVRVSLEEIDLCKEHPPFFISLLGEQYGTVVENAEFQALHNHKPDFDWLKNYPSASITELEIIHAIRLERGSVTFDELAKSTLFYMRSPASERANFVNAAFTDKQTALKKRICDKGLLVTDYNDPEDLKNRVLRQLWHAINQRFPLSQKPTPLEQKTLDHEAFADSRTKIYIERSADLQRLDEHAASEDKPLVILGESGSGKSALLANWALRYRESHPDDLVILYFIGSSPDSTDYVDMLHYVMARLKAHYDIHAQGRTILILDGLNQLTDNADNLAWLPEIIPSNVRLFLSTDEGESLEALQRGKWQSFTVAPLSATERETLITKYLKKRNKQRVERIVAAPQTGNPLYLRVLLEELRLFGSHDKLDAQIDYYLAAPTVIDLYEKVLSRLEADYEQERSGLVKEAFSLLWAARRGLTLHELLELLDIPQAIWSPLFLAAPDALVNRGGLLNFSHDYLRQAVARRYLPTVSEQQRWHLRLAVFFENKLGMDHPKTVAIRNKAKEPSKPKSKGGWFLLAILFVVCAVASFYDWEQILQPTDTTVPLPTPFKAPDKPTDTAVLTDTAIQAPDKNVPVKSGRRVISKCGKKRVMDVPPGMRVVRTPFGDRLMPIEPSEEEKAAKSEKKVFKKHVIKEEDVPPGMRVIHTPFGDRLVPIK